MGAPPRISPAPNPKFSTAKYEPFCGGTATTSARGVRRRAYIDNLCRLTEIEVGSVGADDFEVANISESRIFEYDDLGRLLKTKQGSASGGSVYGQAVYGVNAYGASGSASMDERSYVYDSLDRVRMVTFEDGKTMEYFYDFEGNVTRVVENASGTSKTTQFSYYGDNRLHQVTYVRASGNQVFTYDYDPGGRPEKLTYPLSTGIVAEFEGPNGEPGWDGNGQLKHLRYMKGTDTIRRFAFEYDLAGNRISQLDVVDIAQPLTQRAVEWVYGYDWLDRLESVKKREATTVADLALEPLQLTSMYRYDAADNRIEFQVPNLQQPALTETFTYGYDASDNILSISKAVGTGSANEIEAFTSDDDGNLTTRTSGGVITTYTWNDFNRLAAISTSDNSKKQSHTFGVNGFRRKKKDKNDVETTEYAAGLATAVSKAQAGDTITYLMGHRLMGFERQSDGAMFWFVTDSLSTVRDVVDSSGEVKARYEFSEYGQRIATSESGASSQKTYVGGMSVQDEVADTGLMMMGHRFYDPSGPAGGTGRFLNRDPIGFRGGLNLFEYGRSSPIAKIDPRGLQTTGEQHAVFVGDYAWDPSAWEVVDGPYKPPAKPSYEEEPPSFIDPNFVIALENLADYWGLDRKKVVLAGTATAVAGLALELRGSGGRGRYGATNGGSHFKNPSGGSLSRGACGGIRVNQRGFDIVYDHLNNVMDDFLPNQEMLQRLAGARDSGQRIYGGDANFYLHEVSEATMMRRGMDYDSAHLAALRKYGVHDFAVYPKDLILQFSEWFNKGFLTYGD